MTHPTDTQNAETLIQTIKKLYPNPQCYEAGKSEGYCVGGAVTQFVGTTKQNYPMPGSVTRALMKLNSNLIFTHAMNTASRITNLNDQGKFNEAWQEVEKCLT